MIRRAFPRPKCCTSTSPTGQLSSCPLLLPGQPQSSLRQRESAQKWTPSPTRFKLLLTIGDEETIVSARAQSATPKLISSCETLVLNLDNAPLVSLNGKHCSFHLQWRALGGALVSCRAKLPPSASAVWNRFKICLQNPSSRQEIRRGSGTWSAPAMHSSFELVSVRAVALHKQEATSGNLLVGNKGGA